MVADAIDDGGTGGGLYRFEELRPYPGELVGEPGALLFNNIQRVAADGGLIGEFHKAFDGLDLFLWLWLWTKKVSGKGFEPS